MREGLSKVVAVDVGGTFTDVCVLDQEHGTLEVAKVSSTPNPIDGVLAGVEHAGVNMNEIALFCHGTTVATNALITRRLPPAAMVTSQGFRDVIEIRRGTRDDLWDAYKDNAPPYIRRRDRFEVPERIDCTGQVLEPLDEDAVRNVARILKRRGVETVAVCLINAYANPTQSSASRRSWPRSWARTSRCRPPATSCLSCSSTSAFRPRSPTRC